MSNRTALEREVAYRKPQENYLAGPAAERENTPHVLTNLDELRQAEHRPGFGYFVVKRLADIVLATLALVVLAPALLIIMLLIVVDDFGWPLYISKRVGKDGREFNMYKFRSMRKNADCLENMLTPEELERYKQEYKLDHDPRVTRIGNFIRKTSIDELPQLLNIIKGDLSVVGPRPVLQEETELYGIYRTKFLSIKPGLTGYWQAYARNTVGYENKKRQRMELYYVDNGSAWLDLKIICKTFESVLRKSGAK